MVVLTSAVPNNIHLMYTTCTQRHLPELEEDNASADPENNKYGRENCRIWTEMYIYLHTNYFYALQQLKGCVFQYMNTRICYHI